jgi:hypothetical protein
MSAQNGVVNLANVANWLNPFRVGWVASPIVLFKVGQVSQVSHKAPQVLQFTAPGSVANLSFCSPVGWPFTPLKWSACLKAQALHALKGWPLWQVGGDV